MKDRGTQTTEEDICHKSGMSTEEPFVFCTFRFFAPPPRARVTPSHLVLSLRIQRSKRDRVHDRCDTSLRHRCKAVVQRGAVRRQ